MKTEDLEYKIRHAKRYSERLFEGDNCLPTFLQYLTDCMEKRNIKRAQIIRVLDVDRNYGYQLINGTRAPTRVQVIRMALFMQLDLKSTQKLLNLAGRESLYVRRPEDARTIYCIEHDIPYDKAYEFIWRKPK